MKLNKRASALLAEVLAELAGGGEVTSFSVGEREDGRMALVVEWKVTSFSGRPAAPPSEPPAAPPPGACPTCGSRNIQRTNDGLFCAECLSSFGPGEDAETEASDGEE